MSTTATVGVGHRLPTTLTALTALTAHGGAGRVLHLTGPGHQLTASSAAQAPLLSDADRAMLRAVSGVSFTPDGRLDRPDAVGVGGRGGIVAGGLVAGAIPGGYDTVSFNDGENQVTFFLARVSGDRAAGTLTGDINPQYLRGMLLTLGSSDTPQRRQFIEQALTYYDRLPRSADESRQRAGEPTFTVTA